MICGVIGSPVGHSRSPALHQAAYRWLGLDWTYERHEVCADEVPGFVAGLSRDWRGLSVTMPCKAAIVALGQPDAVVQALGVGNTVIFDGTPSDPATTRVANTDVGGVTTVVQALGFSRDQPVTVWGNGATARAGVYALAQLGAPQVTVRARNAEATARLTADAADWGIAVVAADNQPDGHLVISTVPAAVAGQWCGQAHPDQVFDVLYNPWPTPLAAWARQRGVPTATGLDLLAAQAVGQVLLMTGQSVPLEVLREAATRTQPHTG